jgi:hypothetical protein
MTTDAPDLCLFKLHLEEAPFLAGVDAGYWGLASDDELSRWPYCRIWVRSAPRFIAAGKVMLRFQADNYPATAPTARPWEIETDGPLKAELWPKGPRNVSAVFNPIWNSGVALYAPCDRVAMPGHDSWQQAFPQWWWTPKHTIVEYLTFVFRCLNPVGNE